MSVTAQWMAAGLLIAVGCAQAAVPVAIPAPAGDAPTFTLLSEVDDPDLVLLVVLGGEGRVGLTEQSTTTRNQTAQMAQLLLRRELSPRRVDVVIIDSPVELSPPRVRSEAAHLDRLESVVRYYRERFKRPVWLLGHSNGSISVTEYLLKKQAATPVAGAVLSGSVYYINLADGMNLPLLFLHHEEDGCRMTGFGQARRNYETAKGYNRAVTEFAAVQGGQEQGDPCRNGKHMYSGAYEDAARRLADFLARNTN